MLLALPVCLAAAEPVWLKGHPADPGRVLVKLKAGGVPALAAPKAQDFAALGEAVHAQVELMPAWFILEEPPQAAVAGGKDAKARVQRLEERLEKLRRSGLFERVEPDWLWRKAAAPADAAFADGRLWGLRNTGQNGGVAGVDIGAPAAWDISVGSTNVIVAVVDTGIRYTHQDLQANMWRNPGEVPGNGRDDDGDGYVDNVHGINAITGSGNPQDDDGHGTHVAGTIGAAANNGHAAVGVAWQVRLMACKFLGADGTGKTSDAIKCFDFAVAKGARVINASFGGGPYSAALFEAVARARDRGVLVVAAAGNSGLNNDAQPHYPSSYDLENVIAVAAINRSGQLADFSNYGQTSVDLAAPGVAIFSCYNGSDADYKTIDGTSMAAPHVSGVAALLWAAQPGLSVSAVRQRLLGTAVPLPALQNQVATGGRVNAAGALQGLAADSLLLVAQPAEGSSLVAGSPVRLSVVIYAATNIADATVTAQPSGEAPLTLAYSAVENHYAAEFTVPPFGESISIAFSVSIPGRLATNWVAQYSVLTPPANNDFAKRAALEPVAHTVVEGSTRQASREPGEPLHAGNAGGASVWWTWTAPAAGDYVIRTTGSNFDTLLAVYTGSSLAALSLVAANDDDPGEGVSSRVRFSAAAGVECQIAVDGYNGASGGVRLTLEAVPAGMAPVNDHFAQRLALGGTQASTSGTNTMATKEGSEPNHAGNAGGASVWWTWTAPESGVVTVATAGSNFDTLLAVYTGSSLAALSPVAANDDVPNGGVTSRVQFEAAAGTAYQIAVDGYGGAQGSIALQLALAAGPGRPVNDDLANATLLSGTNVSASGANRSATRETGEPLHAGNSGGKSVWWRWEAPMRGTVTLSTRGSGFDTLLAVYTGASVSALTTIAANDDDPAGGVHSEVSWNVEAGQAFYFCVDGYRDTGGSVAEGSIQLALYYAGVRPPNDDFADRILLTGTRVATSGTSLGATAQSGEPAHNGYNANRSVWWSWRAPREGFVYVSTRGSAFDTLLAVYRGTSLAALASVQGNDDALTGAADESRHSEAWFYAFSNVTYQIAVDGFDAAVGGIELTIIQQIENQDVYYTDFDAGSGFVAGQTLHGQQGWQVLGVNAAAGVVTSGAGGSQQAYIGFSPTSSSAASRHYAWRPINLIAATNQLVRFSTLLRLVDSTNGRWDQFAWAMFNRAGEFLFEVRFHNDEAPVGIYYRLNDNTPPEDTGLTIANDVEYELVVLMDFSRNVWEASLDGMTLVERQPINTRADRALDLGEVDAVWYWLNPPNAGNNYMLFDEYRVEVLEMGRPPAIFEQPRSVAVTEGATVLLNAVASGSPPLMYRWQRDGQFLSGATNATLVLGAVSLAQAGSYQVVITNWFGAVTSAPALVQVNRALAPPANDRFSQRIMLTGPNPLVQISNLGATQEAGEPYHAGNAGGASVWWSWTAPFTGRFTVSTVGSDFDTLLAVYTGAGLDSLALVTANDDAQAQQRGSWLTFLAQSNVTYHIAVDGYNGAYGNVRLSLKPDAAPRLLAPELSQGLILDCAAEQGLRFELQSSTNLLNWVTETNLLNHQGTLRFILHPSGPQRFYRVVQP